MASVPDKGVEPVDRRLVLRRITQELTDRASPLLDANAGERDDTWELADPWGPHRSSAALAVTRHEGDMVLLMQIKVHDFDTPGMLRCLVQELVAALRRTDASIVSSSLDDPAIRAELSTAGFVQLMDEPRDDGMDSPSSGRRMILQL